MVNQAVIRAAAANAIGDSVAVRSLVHRATQTIVAEAYLNEIIQRNLDPNYPPSSEVASYYAEHQYEYRLPDRVHVWQVFIPAPGGSPETVRRNASALAEQVAADVGSGKISIEDAARKYSKHIPSRLNGGYLGLLQVSEMLPEIGKEFKQLSEGDSSAVIVTEAGYHVIKRGATVNGALLELAVVRERVRSRLREQAIQKIRQRASEKIVASYPVAFDESRVDEWRDALRNEDWSAAAQNVDGFERAVDARANTAQ